MGFEVLYGNDDRQEIKHLEELQLYAKRVAENAKAVCMLVHEDALRDEGNGFSRLITQKLHVVMRERFKIPLSKDEPYRDQPRPTVSNVCSAFLVGKREIATAMHCLKNQGVYVPVEKLRVVFDFKVENSDEISVYFNNDTQIYRITKKIDGIVGRRLRHPDWALFQLDRDTNRSPLVLEKNNEVSEGAPVYVIGHPMALPMKFADNANVYLFKDCRYSRHYFRADLDTYGGNSGSPVFHAKTHSVIGILVAGGQDFMTFQHPNGQTRIQSIQTEPDEARKEIIQRIKPVRISLAKYNNSHISQISHLNL
ncbi:MAG: trypsin-like serine peptidase [Flammeovirgaceae bacterium]